MPSSHSYIETRSGYIYALCDPVSGVVRYVGQTIKKPEVRLAQHLWAAKQGDSVMRVHGWLASLTERPALRVLEVLAGNELDDAERRWMAYYRAIDPGLLNSERDMPKGFRFAGPHSPETRAKIGAAHRGRRHSPESVAHMAVGQRGRTASAETRAKMSAAAKGKAKSPATRAKMAAAQAARTGWKHTPETRAKMSAAQRNPPPERRAKISAAKKGRPWSAARRAAQDAKKLGG